MEVRQIKHKKWWINGFLLLCVILLTVLPLFTLKNAEFSGADGQAEGVINALAPDYVPWFSPVIELPSGEIESLIFALQAAIGSGIICFGLGYMLGKRKKGKEEI